MIDKNKTKAQLLKELKKLRTRVATLEAWKEECKLVDREQGDKPTGYQTLVDLSPDPIVVFQGDRYQFVSPAFTEVFGYTQQEVNDGLSFYELVKEDDKDAVRMQYRNRLAGKQSSKTFRIDLVAKDGKEVACETSATLIEHKGRPAVLVLIRDISERKQAEQAIRASEMRLRTAIESLPFDFFIIDKNGRYVMQNSTCRDRWGDVIGKRPEDLEVDGDNLTLWLNNNRRAFAGEVIKDEVELKVNGGKGFFYNIIAPVTDGDRIPEILGVNIDITDRKRAEEELRRAHDEMEQKVQERTSELLETNEQLRREIKNRKGVEERLRESEKELREQTKALEESNIALRVLLGHRDEERKRLEDTILGSLQKLITPYLQRFKETTLSTEQKALLDILEANLSEVSSPFTDKLSSKCAGITPRELEIAGLIKAGKTNVEIADLLGITENAVSFHRKNLRSKLGLRHKRVNLRSYLLSLV